MVRLRSNRWYSADGQRRSRTVVTTSISGTRRVISLCFLLGLVIVLMQKVSDPQHVSRAFSALGVPLEDPQASGPPLNATQSAGLGTPASQAEASSTVRQRQWANACNDLLQRLMDETSSEMINELSLRWFTAQPVGTWEPDGRTQQWYSGTLVQLETITAELDAQLLQSEEARQAELVTWREMLGRFHFLWESWYSSLQGDVRATIDDELFGRQVTAYLDQRLLANLRDAAPWTKSETLPFWRLLQRASVSELASEGALEAEAVEPPLLNTLQLEAESAQLKGKPIRFRGSVRRVERVERRHALLATSDGYWLLWLRGADQSDQPIAVYTTHSLASQLGRVLEEDRFPEVEVLGLVGKKLAYAATSGVEVAPTLFATSLYQRVAPELAASTKSPETLGRELQIALVGGLLAAGLVLVPILSSWTRKANGKRTRHRPGTRSMGCMAFMVLSAAVTEPARLHATAVPASGQELGQQTEQQQPLPPAGVSTQPPWSPSTQASEMASALHAQFERELDAQFVPALQRYIAGDVVRFPDSGLKLAYAMRRLARQHPSIPELSFALDSANAKLTTMERSGWVRLAMPVALEEQQQLWFQPDDQPRLYRLEIDLGPPEPSDATPDGQRRLLTVFCERIPRNWLTARQLLQPVQLRGLAVTTQAAPAAVDKLTSDKLTNDQGAHAPILCLFATAVQWRQATDLHHGDLEENVALQPALTVNARRLLAAGWDLAHLDEIRRRQQQPLATDDLEPFYSLLAVAERVQLERGGRVAIANRGPPQAAEGEAENLFDILKDPASHAATHVQWPIRLVRGTEVRVTDPQATRLLGSSTYFQFDGFVDIGQKIIQYRTGNEETAQVVPFQGEFPITLVSRTCPASFDRPAGAASTTWEIGRAATASGLFFRLWSYESERMNAVKSTARQAAPLVILQDLQPRTVQVDRSENVGWFGYALMVAVVVISGGIVWLVISKK